MSNRQLVTLIFVVGIALGVTTRLADSQENALAVIGSLAAPWILSGFVVGAMAGEPRRGMAAGALALSLAVGVYYSYMRLFEGGVNPKYFLTITTFWLLLATPAGTVFGLAGGLWRRRVAFRTPAVIAVALVSGLIAGEGSFMAATSRIMTIGEFAVFGGFVLIGAALPAVLLSRARDRAIAYGVAGLTLLIGLATVPFIRFLVAQFEQVTTG